MDDIFVVQLEEAENENGPDGQSDERFQDGLDVGHFVRCRMGFEDI